MTLSRNRKCQETSGWVSIKSKDLRCSGLNLALVPDPEDPEKVLRNPKESQSYTNAQSDIYNSETQAGLSSQESAIEKDIEITSFRHWFSTRAEIHSLVATEPRNLDCFAFENAMIQEIEETLAEAKDTGLLFSRRYRCQKCLLSLPQNGIKALGITRISGHISLY